jgi:hypothetical protein
MPNHLSTILGIGLIVILSGLLLISCNHSSTQLQQSDQINWTTYTGGDGSYSLQYPDTCKIVNDDINGGSGVLFSSKNPEFKAGAYRVWKEETLSHTVDLIFKGLGEKDPDYKLVSRSNILWQDIYNACEFSYIFNNGNDLQPQMFKIKSIYIENKLDLFRVYGFAEPTVFDTNSRTIDTIINSFRFLQK